MSAEAAELDARERLQRLRTWFMTVPEAGTYAATTMLGHVQALLAARTYGSRDDCAEEMDVEEAMSDLSAAMNAQAEREVLTKLYRAGRGVPFEKDDAYTFADLTLDALTPSSEPTLTQEHGDVG